MRLQVDRRRVAEKGNSYQANNGMDDKGNSAKLCSNKRAVRVEVVDAKM
jgi:hypothetical protein